MILVIETITNQKISKKTHLLTNILMGMGMGMVKIFKISHNGGEEVEEAVHQEVSSKEEVVIDKEIEMEIPLGEGEEEEDMININQMVMIMINFYLKLLLSHMSLSKRIFSS